jgi:predicted amidohydrolase
VIVAAAQSCSQPGAVAANVAAHLRLVRAAARQGAALVVFPELSLTGYELDRIGDPACDVVLDDPRLGPLRVACRESGTVAVVGAPVPVDGGGRLLAALVIGADGTVSVCAKTRLHGAETEHFVAGRQARVHPVAGVVVGLAVCADLSDPGHAAESVSLGAQLYAVGALVSQAGYEMDADQLVDRARTHRMPVVLANHGAPTGGWQPAGRSAVWDAEGRLVAEAPVSGEHLVVADVRPLSPHPAG